LLPGRKPAVVPYASETSKCVPRTIKPVAGNDRKNRSLHINCFAVPPRQRKCRHLRPPSFRRSAARRSPIVLSTCTSTALITACVVFTAPCATPDTASREMRLAPNDVNRPFYGDVHAATTKYKDIEKTPRSKRSLLHHINFSRGSRKFAGR